MCSMAVCGECGMCSAAWESAPADVTACEFSGHRFEDGVCVDCGEVADDPDPEGCDFCGRTDCGGDCPQRFEAMDDEIFDDEVDR